MTENKRYSEQNLENHLNRIFDNHECKVIFDEEIVDKLNEQDTTIKRLKTIREEQIQTILKQKRKIKELEQELQNLQTFKKVLEFAEKDMEERADWQAYCEKEFEGL